MTAKVHYRNGGAHRAMVWIMASVLASLIVAAAIGTQKMAVELAEINVKLENIDAQMNEIKVLRSRIRELEREQILLQKDHDHP